MMNKNSFEIRIETEAERFLKEMNLLKDNRYKLNKSISKENFEIGRTNNYKEIFDTLSRTSSYDFLLHDDSIFQFQKDKDDYRYQFMQSYRTKISFEEVLLRLQLEPDKITEEEFLYFTSLYEEGSDDCLFDNRNNPLYIRYDVSKMQYKEGIHPYSHLHIGLGNEVRIPLSIILTPEMFVLFVIKMSYPQVWEKNSSNGKIKEMMNSFKAKCEQVDKNFWSNVDMQDLYLK